MARRPKGGTQLKLPQRLDGAGPLEEHFPAELESALPVFPEARNGDLSAPARAGAAFSEPHSAFGAATVARIDLPSLAHRSKEIGDSANAFILIASDS